MNAGDRNASLIITSVERQKRRRNRYHIYVNEEFAFSVHEDILVKYGLTKGTTIDESLRLEVLAEEEFNAAYRTAIRYIGYAMRSEKEVRDKLLAKDYSADLITQVIKRMVEQRYIDDSSYASSLAKERLHLSKKGSLWIRRELAQKGITRDMANDALLELDPTDEAQQAYLLACKRWSSTKGDNTDKLRKIIALLQRRGFSGAAVRHAADQLRKYAMKSDDSVEWYDSIIDE